MLNEAQSRSLPNAEFREHDLRPLPDSGVAADGVWCSFAAAYFSDLDTVLSAWTRYLKPDGWIALTEIDDLFGHEPLSSETKALLDAYAREGFAHKRYDFHMGHLARICGKRA